jgi:hypothetical protein
MLIGIKSTSTKTITEVITRGFIGLPELYGLKCENLITSVIVFVLMLL